MGVCNVSWWKIGRNWIIVKITQILPPGRIKNALLRHIGVRIGKRVFISPDVIIDPIRPELIQIDSNVLIGWGARLFTHMITEWNGKEKCNAAHIHIKKNAFVGGYTTIRPGVTVGEGAFVGSDSLVIHDVGDGEKVFGIPARVR